MFDDAARAALGAFREGAAGAGGLAKKGALAFTLGVPTAAAWEGTRRVMSPELYKSKATITSEVPVSTNMGNAGGSAPAASSPFEQAKSALAEAALAEALHDIKARNSVL